MSNEAAEYKQPKKIFAISGIEGNFNALSQVLLKNKIINKYFEWIFNEGHLVLLGDCLDKGKGAIECLWLIYSLEEKAKRAGGYVHFILGSREILNLNGNWRYFHPNYADKNYPTRNPPAALYNGNSELYRWICTKNIIEKIGNILFVCGGIAEDILNYDLSVPEINNLVRPFYTRARETFSDPLLHLLFNTDHSPFLYTGYYHPPINEQLLGKTLEHFQVQTIVTGHTTAEQITSYYNGKVVNVYANHTTGKSEALLIKTDRFYRINPEGKKEKIQS